MISRGARLACTLGWVAALALLALYVQRTLVIGTDLRLFMPSPQNAAERLLLEEVGEGPSSRLLLVALAGASHEELAATSRALADTLEGDPQFRLVANGEASVESASESLLAYRYLLTDTLDRRSLDAGYLRKEIEQRERDLASAGAGVIEDILPRDPTLELAKLADAWQPAREPQHIDEVWFDSKGERALLLVETRAAAFDPEGQRSALMTLRARFEQVREAPAMRLIASGPGTFSVLMKDRTQAEAQGFGALALAGLVALLLAAYRAPSLVLPGALPLASAGLAGLAAVSALFGTVHGITLAFGFTLIGVAQDYPLHLFSHRRPGEAPEATARAVWPPLATGVASTCIAYLAFVRSGIPGLAQLGAFTIAGLAVAGLTTRYALPHLLPPATRDYGESRAVGRTASLVEGLPARGWWGFALALAALTAVALAPGPFWQNDLSRLTPVPQELLREDASLRRELGAPDVRHLLVVGGENAEQTLSRLERLTPDLDALVRTGAIDGYDHAARYLPSATTQRRRQAALPEVPALRRALDAALTGRAFRPELFEPFLADVARARSLPPLTPAELVDTPLGARVGNLLAAREGRWTALVTLSGVRDLGALAAIAARQGDAVTLLDLKSASETLIARQRLHMLWSLAAAGALLVGVVFLALRRPSRVWRVIAPMLVTTVLVIAVLRLAGVPLTLFHLIALVLAAGLGLDYALFFEHAAEDPHARRRTLHAVTVCALSTLMVFALLALSSIPVLRAIGVTVAAGVVANFVLALLITRTR